MPSLFEQNPPQIMMCILQKAGHSSDGYERDRKLRNGKIIFEKPKDELMYRYGLLKCGKSQFERLDKGDIVTCLERDYEWQVLTDDRDRMQKKYPDMLISPATIDEIMMLYIRGKRV